ncbi:MAG TPA: hypothetical protein VJ828_00475 [Lacipirellulaceae bacterium]|nr:hypothetical protein [Lacipirellulaceae bacterium]
MTQLLEQAIAELHKLSASDQDAIASLILAEITDERRWELAFTSSQEQLQKMADKVRDDIRTGRVRDMGIDEL